MKPCYNIQTCDSSSLEQDVALCAKHGFKSIEICFAKADEYLKNHSLNDLTALLKEYDVTCETLNAIFDNSFLEGERLKRTEELFQHACELGQACGTDKVIVLSSERADLPQGVTEQNIWDDTVAILNHLADLGQPTGMKIAFEPVGTMAVGSLKRGHDIVKSINRPEIGLVVDDFNMFVYDLCSDMDEIREFDKDKIFIVHINDAEKLPFAWIDQTHRCMPGDGRIDVRKYIDCVRATGYDGPVSVEVLNPAIWAKGAEILVPEAYEKVMKFIQ